MNNIVHTYVLWHLSAWNMSIFKNIVQNWNKIIHKESPSMITEVAASCDGGKRKKHCMEN